MFLIRQKKGQGLVEYMVLVALIAIGTVGVVRVVGSNIAVQFENINRGLGSKTAAQLQTQRAPCKKSERSFLLRRLESAL